MKGFFGFLVVHIATMIGPEDGEDLVRSGLRDNPGIILAKFEAEPSAGRVIDA